jgi:glucose/galactose transporter
MGICNKVAGVLAPIILGSIILSDADILQQQLLIVDEEQKNILLNELASRVILPYSLMAIALCGLAFMVRYSPLPEIELENEVVNNSEANNKSSVLHYPALVLGAIALFLYVGVEVLAGDTIGTFGQSQGIPLSEAKNFTSYTLAAMVVGYILGIIAIPKFITQSKALAISAIIGLVFSILIVTTSGYTAVLYIALLGLANALMWPAIWPLAIEGLGKFTKTGSALLIMAIAGGALLPLLYGWLADQAEVGHQFAYLIMIPSYAFILFYSIKGHTIKKW